MGEFCLESLKFWLAANEFSKLCKTTDDPDKIAEAAGEIVEQYVVEGAPYQVNLSDAMRSQLVDRIHTNEESPQMLAAAQQEVEGLMQDTFRRWARTDEFQEVTEQMKEAEGLRVQTPISMITSQSLVMDTMDMGESGFF